MAGNRKLDVNHDIIIRRGTVRATDQEYVAQLVKCRLLVFAGEWALNRSLGIPWQGVLDRSYDITATKFAVQNTILETPGVRSLESLNLRADTTERKLVIEFVATTEYGSISSEVQV